VRIKVSTANLFVQILSTLAQPIRQATSTSHHMQTDGRTGISDAGYIDRCYQSVVCPCVCLLYSRAIVMRFGRYIHAHNRRQNP